MALISLVYALGPTSVLFGKHTDKLEADRAKGVRSMPVLMGEALARKTVLAMLAVQYALSLGLVISGVCGMTMLLVLLNLPVLRRLWQTYLEPRPQQRPDEFPQEIWPLWYSAFAFDHTRKFSGLFLLALLIDGWLA